VIETRLLAFFPVVALLSGCALKGDVRRVERQLIEMKDETARADSVRTVSLDRILSEIEGLQVAIRDSLEAQHRAIEAIGGEFRSEFTDVRRQLVAIQELTGQSQARLTELRSQFSNRASQPATVGSGVQPPSAGATGNGAEEMYSVGVEQLRQRSYQTARIAFRQIVDQYPEHARAAAAQYYLGETFESEAPDSAAVMWETVVERYPESRRAPSALYKLGLLFELRGDVPTARLHYNRVIVGYPDSDEAQLARAKLRNP